MENYIDLWTRVPDIVSLGEEAIRFFNKRLPETDREPKRYLQISDKTTRETLLLILIDASDGASEVTIEKKALQRVQDQTAYLLSQNKKMTSRESDIDDSFWCPAGAVSFRVNIISVRGNDSTNGSKPANKEQEIVHDENEAIAMIIGIAFLPIPDNLSELKIAVKMNKSLRKIAIHFSKRTDNLLGDLHEDVIFKLRLGTFFN